MKTIVAPPPVGKDVADRRGYSETNCMIRRLDAEDFISTKLEGMNMKSTIINESGLFSLTGIERAVALCFCSSAVFWVLRFYSPQRGVSRREAA